VQPKIYDALAVGLTHADVYPVKLIVFLLRLGRATKYVAPGTVFEFAKPMIGKNIAAQKRNARHHAGRYLQSTIPVHPDQAAEGEARSAAFDLSP
jgi:hypothetical protein